MVLIHEEQLRPGKYSEYCGVLTCPRLCSTHLLQGYLEIADSNHRREWGWSSFKAPFSKPIWKFYGKMPLIKLTFDSFTETSPV